VLYEHDLDKANEVASAALEKLHSLNIAPSPDNFEVWYLYYAQLNPDLRTEIEEKLKVDGKISETTCRALYEKYVSDSRYQDLYKKAGDQIHSTIEDVSGLVNTVKSATDEYAGTLEDVNERLTSAGSKEQLEEIVHDVVKDTGRLLEQNKQLQEQLLRSTSAMDELKRDMDKIRREAMTDGLTGLANRKMLDEQMAIMLEHAEQSGLGYVLMILDIDHFKAFNDNYGHQVGDQVLRLVARTLTDGVKGRDIVARYGGEEFVVLLPDTDLKSGLAVAENLRKAVANKEVINRSTGERLGRITMSAGVAQYAEGDSVESLIERADSALYTAKHGGRNQVAGANPASSNKKAG
jgi:diguanylate cyclase